MSQKDLTGRRMKVLAIDKGKEILEEKGDLVPKSGEQDKHEETTKPGLVELYRLLDPLPQRLGKAKLKAKFRKLLEVFKKL